MDPWTRVYFTMEIELIICWLNYLIINRISVQTSIIYFMYTNSHLVANQAVTLTKAVANKKIENGQLKCSGGLFASSEGTFLSQQTPLNFSMQFHIVWRISILNQYQVQQTMTLLPGSLNTSRGTFLSQHNTFEFQYAVPHRVENINFKPMSSAADDDTSSRLLKYIEITVASTLSNLMSQSLSTGIFSYQLKLA